MRLRRLEPRETGRDAGILIACLTGLAMIWELPRLLYVPNAEIYTGWIQIAEMILAGAVLSRIDYREHRWMITLLLGLGLIFLTSAIRPPVVLEWTKAPLLRAMFLYILCPAIGILLSEKNIRTFLMCFIPVWVLFHTVMSALGIYSMYTGAVFMDFSGLHGVHNDMGHLNLISYYTISAANLMIAIMMAVVGFGLTKIKTLKILTVVCILIMQYALALTTGRAGMIATGIGLGIAAAAYAETKLRGKIRIRWKRILALGCVVAIATAGAYGIFMAEEKLFNRQVSGRENGLILRSAKAEEETAGTGTAQGLQTRSFGEYGLSGREGVYRRAFELLGSKPHLLIMGTSVPLAMEYLNEGHAFEEGEIQYEHVHSMPLMILLETGVGGLILLILFMIPFFQGAWRLFFAAEEPGWKRLIFLPTLCLFCIETIECITRLEKELQAAVPMFLFYGLTVCLAKTVKPDGSEAGQT